MPSATTRDNTLSVDELTRDLQKQRDLAAARRADELERKRSESEHARARADVDEGARLAEMARAEREADARADAELGQLLRETRAAGQRARVSAAIARSGEARAARLERTRALNLRVLIPVLIGFGAWSTAGVQQGGARLMDVTSTDPTWWALWALEPVLIGVVVWVIIARARLATAGGKMSDGAERIAAAALTTSVLLNLIAALPTTTPVSGGATVAVVGSMLAHAIGPIGAAATAYLIGVVDASVSAADPWADSGTPAPRLAELTNLLGDTEDAPKDAQPSPAPRSRGRDRADAETQTDPAATVDAPGRASAPTRPRKTAQPADAQPPRRGGQRDIARDWYFKQREAGVDEPKAADIAQAVAEVTGNCSPGQSRKLRDFCDQQWAAWVWYVTQREAGVDEPKAADIAQAVDAKSDKDSQEMLRYCEQRWATQQRRDIRLVGGHAA